MNAADLIAFDVDGARYCLDCCRKHGISLEEKPDCGGPVFAVDVDPEESCSGCFELIVENAVPARYRDTQRTASRHLLG